MNKVGTIRNMARDCSSYIAIELLTLLLSDSNDRTCTAHDVVLFLSRRWLNAYPSSNALSSVDTSSVPTRVISMIRNRKTIGPHHLTTDPVPPELCALEALASPMLWLLNHIQSNGLDTCAEKVSHALTCPWAKSLQNALTSRSFKNP